MLLRRALASPDEDVREIGQDVADEFGTLVIDPQWPRRRQALSAQVPR
jgi:hypothetical protein